MHYDHSPMAARPDTPPTAPLHPRSGGTLRISAKADYAVRAAIELAVAHGASRATKGDAIGAAQGIPRKYLERVLGELRDAGLVCSQRGTEGGYWLARPPDEITVADVLRAVDGALADVHGSAPEDVGYNGSAAPLLQVWIAVRSALRDVVEHVSLADLAAGQVPPQVRRFSAAPEAWHRRQAATRSNGRSSSA
jgi:Rrf2 family protein